jgi:hypothetical protein
MHRIPILGAAVLLPTLLVCVSRAAAQAPAVEVSNPGDDFTYPINRFSVRNQLTDYPDSVTSGGVLDNRFRYSETLRADLVVFKKPNQLQLRFDLPLAWANRPTQENPDGHTQFGSGDILAQAVYVHAFNARWAAAVGLRAYLPTATQLNLGAGKWQLGPIISIRAALPELSRGSYVSVSVRESFTVAGDPARATVRYFVVRPSLNIGLPSGWFLNSTPVIRYNRIAHAWFVPVDFIVGRKFARRWIASFEYSYGWVRDDFRYKHYADFQIGYLF